ncbi:MAG: hypothetical protein WCE80_14995 [Acidimicrobiia bacterium]
MTTDAARGQHQTGFRKRLNDHLDAIGVPTLVMCGAHDESLLVDAVHHLAAEQSDRGPLIIDGTAHLPSLDRPNVLNEFSTSSSVADFHIFPGQSKPHARHLPG